MVRRQAVGVPQLGLQAADLNVHGERRESHKLYQRAADAARHLGLR
jgi:hypothetical protein